MFPSLAQTTALVLSSTTLALSQILVPSVITADVSAQIKLTESSLSSDYDSYRVYLAMTPPGWGTGPACYLVNSSSTAIVDFNVAIPASVGPSGSKYYSISIMQFNSNPDADAAESSFSYSPTFNFQGGKGNWSTYETTGHTVSDADTLPCSAYDCARNCSQTYYPADVADVDDINADKAAYECIGRCPSVVQPSWDSLDDGTITAEGGAASTASTRVATSSPSGIPTTRTGTAVTQGTTRSTTSSSASRTSSGAAGANTASLTSSATSTPTNESTRMKTGGLLAAVAGVFALVL